VPGSAASRPIAGRPRIDRMHGMNPARVGLGLFYAGMDVASENRLRSAPMVLRANLTGCQSGTRHS